MWSIMGKSLIGELRSDARKIFTKSYAMENQVESQYSSYEYVWEYHIYTYFLCNHIVVMNWYTRAKNKA